MKRVNCIDMFINFYQSEKQKKKLILIQLI